MPKEIILIAAVTIDGFIARHNKEVISWSLDLPLFKKQTIGHSIIMGSNTRKVISKELSGRKNIVVTRCFLLVSFNFRMLSYEYPMISL